MSRGLRYNSGTPFKDAKKRRTKQREYDAKRKPKSLAWRKAHKNEKQTYDRAYRKKHHKKIRKQNAAYRLANPDRIQQYLKTHAEKIRARQAAKNRTMGGRFSALKSGAKERDIAVELTLAQYIELRTNAVCCYCEEPLPETCGGLDRKNSNLGYALENCVPACRTCNVMRGEDAISYEEMFEVVKLLKHLRSVNKISK